MSHPFLRRTAAWCGRFLLALLMIMVIGWLMMDALQWRLRWRAEAMLADVQGIQVGVSSAESARAILNKWSRWGEVQTYCKAGKCQSFVIVIHYIPRVLNANDDQDQKGRLRRIADHLGLRAARVGAGFTYKDGIVIAKGFSEDVSLPQADFLSRGGAYVPDLIVSANEKLAFGSEDQFYLQLQHPDWYIRRMKGAWGVIVNSTVQEDPDQRRKKMDFGFSCVTQFFPCRNEEEILSVAAQVSQE